jgi:hypothetical protein
MAICLNNTVNKLSQVTGGMASQAFKQGGEGGVG